MYRADAAATDGPQKDAVALTKNLGGTTKMVEGFPITDVELEKIIRRAVRDETQQSSQNGRIKQSQERPTRKNRRKTQKQSQKPKIIQETIPNTSSTDIPQYSIDLEQSASPISETLDQWTPDANSQINQETLVPSVNGQNFELKDAIIDEKPIESAANKSAEPVVQHIMPIKKSNAPTTT